VSGQNWEVRDTVSTLPYWIKESFGPRLRSRHRVHPPVGIGGYDLLSPDDRAFDYNSTGKSDHLISYDAEGRCQATFRSRTGDPSHRFGGAT
jgi:hypothetical protein